MGAATWYILVGVVALLVLVAVFGDRGERSPARRVGAMIRQAENQEIILSEIGVVIGGVLFTLGLLHAMPLWMGVGLVLMVAALLRAVIHHSAAS